MIPLDKFGKPIFPSKYKKLQENCRVLFNNGYLESDEKPNLFYRKVPRGWVNADMRGTEEVLIWDDTRPLFYWRFESTPMWERRRVVKTELRRLFKSGCACRLSFYAYRSAEFIDVSASIDEQEDIRLGRWLLQVL